MKEIPILFSTSMVQALLAGRKTKTRRIIDPQPLWTVEADGNLYEGNHKGYVKVDGHPDWPQQFAYQFAKWKKGDLLWVRESFRVNSWMPEDGEVNFRYEADGALSPFIWFEDGDDGAAFNRYWEQSCADLAKAGYEPNEEERYEDYDHKALRLRPNIFMVKEAARIWLQVTDVKVERLQDISKKDAIAEGVEKRHGATDQTQFDYRHYKYDTYDVGAYVSFRTLWEKINGADSWQTNPWVWCVSFNILSTTGKPDLNNQ